MKKLFILSLFFITHNTLQAADQDFNAFPRQLDCTIDPSPLNVTIFYLSASSTIAGVGMLLDAERRLRNGELIGTCTLAFYGVASATCGITGMAAAALLGLKCSTK